MKQFILISFSLFFTLSSKAQNPAPSFKMARKAYYNYHINHHDNIEDIYNALTDLSEVKKNPDWAQKAKVWQLEGDLFSTVSLHYHVQNLLNREFVGHYDTVAARAFESYREVLKLATKKYERKNALRGIREIQPKLTYEGERDFDAENYKNAYVSFQRALDAHKLLKDYGKKPVIKSEIELEKLLFKNGEAAYKAGNWKTAEVTFSDLRKKKYEAPKLYLYLHFIYSDNHSPEAHYILKEGRKKFPNDFVLLRRQVWYLLHAQHPQNFPRFIEKYFPNDMQNPALYYAVGRLLSNAYKYAVDQKNEDDASRYFDLSFDYFEKACHMDSNYFKSHYEIGALYYYRAIEVLKELAHSNENNKAAYNLTLSLLEKALPWFKRAEILNPNDIKTLIALSEIYARQMKLNIAKTFKERLEYVKEGGHFKESYHK